MPSLIKLTSITTTKLTEDHLLVTKLEPKTLAPARPPRKKRQVLRAPKGYIEYLIEADAFYPRLLARHCASLEAKPPSFSMEMIISSKD